MADYIFKGYDNFVIEEAINSTLLTKLDMNKFMTPDYSLEANKGMTVKVHRYTGSGDAELLARGAGNSNFIDAEYVENNYTVARTQAQAKWYDDDAMADPTLIDTKIKRMGEAMVNAWAAAAVAEFNKTSKQVACTTYGLADFADAINEYTKVYEDQAGLFFLANVEMIPTLRKQLGDYLKYTEDYIRTGAIGNILGVPVYTSKAVPKGIIFMATNEAVKAFMKKNTNIESDRDIDKKENFVVASRYAVIALVDETKCIKLGSAQSVTLTATADVSDATITGAAPTGALVTAYDEDGVEIGHATAASNAYSITYTAGTAGEDIKVVSVIEGYLPASKAIKSVA